MTQRGLKDTQLANARAALRDWGAQFNPDILEKTRALYAPLIDLSSKLLKTKKIAACDRTGGN